MNILIIIVTTFLITYKAFSSVGFEDGVISEFAVSGRSLAMGNAFIAKVDDSSSVFYNPAGLGTVRGVRFHLSNFHVETNRGWMGATSGGSVTDVPANFPKGFSLDGNREILLANRDKFAFSKFSLMPNLTFRNFSIGYLFSRQTRATISSAGSELFEYAVRQDMGPYCALNLPLFGGILKFGATAIWLTRKEDFGDVDKDTTIDLQDGDYNEGTSWQIISGFKFTVPIYSLPTIALKMNNSASTSFGAASGSAGAPIKIKQSVDAGISITPQIGKVMRIHLEFNYKDVTKNYDMSALRRATLGIEFDVKRTFFLRFGYGDGFGSAGLGINTKKLQFDFTTYAVDTTSTDFRGSEDRRFALTVSSGF
ncbi:MAG: hypothetical protein HN576_09750 [Bacteriovoracaceae bacterium]|nr:hypothetical protein [Bacteriovoracaceae bacterium]